MPGTWIHQNRCKGVSHWKRFASSLLRISAKTEKPYNLTAVSLWVSIACRFGRVNVVILLINVIFSQHDAHALLIKAMHPSALSKLKLCFWLWDLIYCISDRWSTLTHYVYSINSKSYKNSPPDITNGCYLWSEIWSLYKDTGEPIQRNAAISTHLQSLVSVNGDTLHPCGVAKVRWWLW